MLAMREIEILIEVDVISFHRHRRDVVQDMWYLAVNHVITQIHSEWMIVKGIVMGWNFGMETYWTGAVVILMSFAIMIITMIITDVINAIGTEATFELRASGVLQVSAEDKGTGKK